VPPRQRPANNGVKVVSEKTGAESQVQESWPGNFGVRDWPKCAAAAVHALRRFGGQLRSDRRGDLRWSALQHLAPLHRDVGGVVAVIAIPRDLDLNASDECVECGGVVRGGKGAARYGTSHGACHCIAHGMAEREPKQGVTRQRCGSRRWCRRNAHG
jgi:hypothetical protein